MVTNAKVPVKYKPKKGTKPVATPAQDDSDKQGADTTGGADSGESAPETGEKTDAK